MVRHQLHFSQPFEEYYAQESKEEDVQQVANHWIVAKQGVFYRKACPTYGAVVSCIFAINAKPITVCEVICNTRKSLLSELVLGDYSLVVKHIAMA